MLNAQLAGCHSLRHLESTFNSHGNHHYHLGVKGIRRSTLADANQKRPLAIYQELFFPFEPAEYKGGERRGTDYPLNCPHHPRPE